MKKLLLTLAIGAAVSLSAGAETYYECLFGAQYNSQKTQDYVSTWSTTNQGSTFTVVNFNNNNNGWANFAKCGRKNNASVATITTGFAATQSINEVVLNAQINAANVMNAIKLETSATADFATILSTVEATSEQINTKGTAASDITFTLASPAANLYYRLTFDCKSASSNGSVSVYSVKYNGGAADTRKDAGLAFPESKYEANLGQTFTAPTLTKATNAAVTYASDKETVATVDATTGAVTLVGEGTARITATAEANDEYRAGSASYLLTVVDPNKPGATISNPMTVAQALEACTSNGPKNVYVKGIVTKVTTAFNSQYNNVSFNIGDEVGSTEILEAYRTKWGADVTPTDDKNPAVGATVILFGNLKIFNGKKELDANNQIVSYTAPALPSAGLSFPEKTYTINLGEAFTAPELTKTTDAAAAYTSSNPAVADVDAATGAVTVKTYGSTVITAKTAETAAYLAGEASYTLVVNNPAITIDAPLTVAQALEVCANEPHNVYVKGIVTEIVTPYDSQYKNVSFNIADEAGATEVLLAYRTKWGEGVTATADNNPEVGATVVIYGDLKIHNDIKEFNANNMIVKYNIPTGIEDIEIEANAPVEYFNLQGVRVANPENGLYIRRQGNKVSKVIVK